MRELFEDVAKIINYLKALNLLKEKDVETRFFLRKDAYELDIEVSSCEAVIKYLVDEFEALGTKYKLRTTEHQISVPFNSSSVKVVFSVPYAKQ